jgi:hypothetical protein
MTVRVAQSVRRRWSVVASAFLRLYLHQLRQHVPVADTITNPTVQMTSSACVIAERTVVLIPNAMESVSQSRNKTIMAMTKMMMVLGKDDDRKG